MNARVPRRRFFVAFLVVALLTAGVASFYASSRRDGLEYVAGKTGFLDSADEEGPSVGSPFADYGTDGVGNERLSGGLAGIAGVALTLGIGGALFFALRRRGAPTGDAAPAGASASEQD